MSEAHDDSTTALSADERQALICVLDEIIPPSADGRLPGAGQLGVLTHVEAALAQTPLLLPAIRQGLASLDDRAASQGALNFASLPTAQRADVLSALAAKEPDFLPGLIFHVYLGYYQEGRVIEALGMEYRPPHPLGYPLAPLDPARLDGIRRRQRLYRDV